MTPGRRGWIVIALVALTLIGVSRSKGAPNHSHDGAAGRFYSTWMIEFEAARTALEGV